MEINLSQTDQQQLARLAMAAGFTDVQQYVTEHVLALTQQEIPDELLSLTPEELKKCLAMIERGETEIEAGGGRDVDSAFQELGDRHGFSLDG